MNNFTINSLVNFVENCLFLLKAKTKRQILFFLTFIFLGTTSVFSQAANLDQVRNGGSGSPTNPGAWVNGNLNSTQSHYTEGQSAPYRVIMTGMPANTLVTLELEYDVKHSGRHALDYLTHYDRLQPHVQYGHASEEIDPTIGTFFTEGSGFTTFTIPPPPVLNSPVVNQPTDSYNNLSAGEKIMTLWGGTITNITYGTTADLSQSNEPQQINVTFMTGNTALTAGELVLAWGGHIASRHDWGSDGGGVPRSAGGISGSPYHMRLIDWNLGNLGNQDRSLSAAAMAAPNGPSMCPARGSSRHSPTAPATAFPISPSCTRRKIPTGSGKRWRRIRRKRPSPSSSWVGISSMRIASGPRCPSCRSGTRCPRTTSSPAAPTASCARRSTNSMKSSTRPAGPTRA